jgi:hypothetical protein
VRGIPNVCNEFGVTVDFHKTRNEIYFDALMALTAARKANK